MILKKQLDIFRNIFNNHLVVNEVMVCELWEVEGNLKPGILYPLIVIDLVSTSQTVNSLQRTYRVLCMDILLKDKSNSEDVLSDSEYILTNFIKTLRDPGDGLELDDMELINEPLLEPFKEEFGDWCSGYSVEITVESGFDNNPCITLQE